MSRRPKFTHGRCVIDYRLVFQKRLENLKKLRADDGLMQACRVYYAEHPADFINDWGMTYDPRNVERRVPAWVPFLLFDKQREWVDYVMRKWRAGEPGLTEKSRDMGVSWMAVGLADTLCLFHRGITIGFGSRKEDYVDKAGDPKALFYKARKFIEYLPPEFRNGFDEKKDSPHMRIQFRETGSVITGEAGDGIGRGDRTSIYFVDEAAHLERPRKVDASLSATTNCRIDISSANGTDNPFYEKRSNGKIEVFTLHWRDDPRKDEAWYAKQCDLLDPITVAQEIDINYAASKSGVIIPSEWVQAAIDAHIKLGIEVTGERVASLDVADEGYDLCAYAQRKGILLESLESWSGKGGDIMATTEKALMLCDDDGCDTLYYDADGLGAGVRGDARIINERRLSQGRKPIKVNAFRGSGEIVIPEDSIPSASREKGDRKNKDFFANHKAQAWWELRVRFQITWRAVTQGAPYDKDDIISLSSGLRELSKLIVELSQPTYTPNNVGKIVVDKAPDGQRSPNHSDTVMILYAPRPRTRRGFMT